MLLDGLHEKNVNSLADRAKKHFLKINYFLSMTTGKFDIDIQLKFHYGYS